MHPLLKPELGLWVWTLVAFLIVLFILKKYAFIFFLFINIMYLFKYLSI